LSFPKVVAKVAKVHSYEVGDHKNSSGDEIRDETVVGEVVDLTIH
jgi:hypothetical protein